MGILSDLLSNLLMNLAEEAIIKNGKTNQAPPKLKRAVKINKLSAFSVFLGLGIYQASQDIWIALLVSGGVLLEREMFGLDLLDCKSSVYKRWGYVRWFWLPYQMFFREKFFFSKVPIIRELVQLSYLISILWIFLAPLDLLPNYVIFLWFCLGFFPCAVIEAVSPLIVSVYERLFGRQKKRMALFGNAISLPVPGDYAPIPIENLQVALQWTASVDLDLHAFFKTKLTAPKSEVPNSVIEWGNPNIGKPGSEGHVSFVFKGNRMKYPWIQLDKDAGVFDTGGNNREILYLDNLQHLEHVLIAVNIFFKPWANFAKYDGWVIVKANNRSFEIPLTAGEGGNWCIIAHVDNSGKSKPVLTNVNKVQKKKPTIASFLKNRQ